MSVSAGTAYIEFKPDFSRVNKSVGALGRPGSSTFNAAKGAGIALGGLLGVGVAAALTKSLKASIEFERSMRNVNSIAKLSEKQLGALSSSALKLAGKVGQSPKTLSEGLYDLVSSGFDAKESMLILESSAKAATAGLTDAAVSTKAVAAVLNAYRRPAKDAAAVSDDLFQIVNVGVLTFEELASSVGDVLPFASSLGVDLKQVGASIATMTKAGISAPETMTRIKAVMVGMLKPSNGMRDAFKEIGVESGEALIKQKGFQGALEALIGATDGTKSAVAELFPDIRGLGGALALTGKNASGAGKDLQAFANDTGAMNAAFKEQSKAVAFQWQKLKAQTTAVGIRIGSTLLPVLNSVVRITGKFIEQMESGKGVGGAFADNIASAFEKIKPTVEAGLDAFAGPDPSKLIGPQLPDKLIGPPLPDTRGFTEKLGAGMAAAMATMDWTGMSEAVADGIRSVFSNIDPEALLSGGVTLVAGILDTLFDPVWMAKHIGDILVIALAIIPVGKITKIPGLKWLADVLWKGLRGAVVFAARMIGKVGWGIIEGGFNVLFRHAPKLAYKMGELLGDLVNVILKLLPKFRSGAGKIGESIGRGIGAAASWVGEQMGKLLGSLVRMLFAAPKAYLAGGRAIVRAIGRGIRALIDDPGRALRTVLDKAIDFIKGAPGRFLNIGKWIVGKIKSGMINAPLDGLKALGKKIGSVIQSGIGKVKALVGIGGTTGALAFGKDKGGFGAVTNMAQKFGNVVTSGNRPGDKGWHGKNRARDYAGGNMLGFAKAVASGFGQNLLELIHTPLGYGIKNGKRVPNSFYSEVLANHYDHVHIAMARGGILGGSGLRDTVPVLAAPGEAFLTRHQQKPVDFAMRNTFGTGLSSVFNNRTPHSVQSFSQGGEVMSAAIKHRKPKTPTYKRRFPNMPSAVGLLDRLWEKSYPERTQLMENMRRIFESSEVPVGSLAFGNNLDVGELDQLVGSQSAILALLTGAITKAAEAARKQLAAAIERVRAIVKSIEAEIGELNVERSRLLKGKQTKRKKAAADRIGKRLADLRDRRDKGNGRLGDFKAERSDVVARLTSFSSSDSIQQAIDDARFNLSELTGDAGVMVTAPDPTDPTDNGLADLLRQQLDASLANNRVLSAQMPIFQKFFPPYGGSFATGGIVPGPSGAPRTIVAHGGEAIGQMGQPQEQQVFVTVVVEDGAVDSNRIRVEVDKTLEDLVRKATSGPAIGRRMSFSG